MSLPHGHKLKFSAILDSMPKTSPNPSVSKGSRKRVFGQGEKTLRAGLYARVSTHDQQTLPMQLTAMREHARKRGWAIAVEIKDVGSGASLRQKREDLLDLARRRQVDLVVVWRLDRWGTIAGGSGEHVAGIVFAEGRLRIVKRGPGPDHPERSCAGRDAGRFCRVRGTGSRPESLRLE